MIAVISQDEVMIGGNSLRPIVAVRWGDIVRLLHELAIYIQFALPYLYHLFRQANYPLDVVFSRFPGKNHYFTPLWRVKKIDRFVHQQEFSVMKAGLHTYPLHSKALYGELQYHQDD